MKPQSQASTRREVLHVISYFAFFGYPPTLKEIHMFLPKKISVKGLQTELDQLTSEKIVKIDKNGDFEAQGRSISRYVLKGDSKFFEQYSRRKAITEGKLFAVSRYLRLLERVPVIRFAGLSGSLSMNNGKAGDDIDLCIVSVPGRIWTARFTAGILAGMLGIKRGFRDRDVRDKICLNLFFDQSNLSIGSVKQTEYVGHELLQLKTVFDHGGVYAEFLGTNEWVFRLFPNAKRYVVTPAGPARAFRKDLWYLLGNIIELILKKLQLWHMQKHRTSEYISDTQLWFFPKDFEKKLKKGVL